ncbi:TetR family transcriptional regulator [Desulfobacterales bacterium HSG16]|nr:TetR family transcriptional regulator [Desulfobacterales bacterium HSG16]
MARKTKEEAEKTRKNILDAALSTFSIKGYMRSSLNDIAIAAGVTRGAIYWHFKDKVDLLEALWEDIDRCHKNTKEDVVRDGFYSIDELRKNILEWFYEIEDNPRLNTYYKFMAYKIEYHEELEPVLAHQREEKRMMMKSLEEDFRQLQNANRMRADIEPGHAALMTFAFVRGLMEHWLFDRTAFSMKKTVPVLLDNFLGGFQASPQKG